MSRLMFRRSFLLLAAVPSLAIVRQVQPGKPHATPCAAIAAAVLGDTIEIDPAGSYASDVCAWSTSGLTIRGVGGRAAIDADGKNAQGKAIWVIAGNDTTIENIELSGAHVIDRNGAGIRLEDANLTLRYCYFHDNDEGILTAANPASRILIEFSEFAYNGYGDGQLPQHVHRRDREFHPAVQLFAPFLDRAPGEVARDRKPHPL